RSLRGCPPFPYTTLFRSEEAARAVARRIRERGYESVAVTFINAYMNGDHEARMKQILEEEAPGVFVCTSYEILPEVFEHERFSRSEEHTSELQSRENLVC